MEKRNIGVLLSNIVCAVILLALVICQLVPFWVTFGENADSASLLGVTGRQYAHEELIADLDVIAGGFSYQDISTQVLLTVALGAFGVILCAKNSRGWLRIAMALVVSIAGMTLWLFVPAYTLGMMGHVLFALDILLLFVAIAMIVLYVFDKIEQSKIAKEKKAKMFK